MKKSITLVAGLFLALSFNVKAADVLVDPALSTLSAAYSSANSGDVLILMDGNFVVDGNITMDKAITVKAQHSKMATISGVGFLFSASSTGNLTVQDVVLDGTKTGGATFASYVVDVNGAAGIALNNILFENCIIKNYGNCFLRANRVEGTCESLKVNNCIIKSNGSVSAYPFFQVTKTRFGTSLELTNSTIADFSNEYIQNYTTTAGGNNDASYIFKNNTFYNTVTVNTRKPFSFVSGKVYVQNNIFVKTTATARTLDVTINPAVTISEFTNNVVYDYDAGALLNSTGWSLSSGNLDVDPGFRDVTNYDFTLPTGSALITANIGDPRWFGTTSTKSVKLNTMLAYPNPTTDKVYFGRVFASLEVSNMLGQKLISSSNTDNLVLSHLMNGNYIMRVTDEQGEVYISKILKK